MISFTLRSLNNCYSLFKYEEGLEESTLNKEEMLLLAEDLMSMSFDILYHANRMQIEE